MKRLFYFLIIQLFVFNLSAEKINMQTAGADLRGKKLNTKLINQTISKLHANGGGTLFFPAGKYLTGAIVMKSNITIELESGATLLFSDDFNDYLPMVQMRHEGILMNSFSPLIYAVDAQNITIKGEGTIDGQGKKWWDEFYRIIVDLKANGMKDLNKFQPMWDKANNVDTLASQINSDYVHTLQRRFFRPPLFQTLRCKNIKIEGVTFQNSPFWTINPQFSENIHIDKVTINNPLSPNTDGINPESCKYVHISNCHISVGDDCITIKSGRDTQGRRLNVPCENITITNCTMLAGHGGVVIGSEMSGGVKKITISNCVFDGTDRGIRIKSTRGRGGVVEDITVSNIIMRNIQEEAIIMDLMYSKMPEEPFSERTPVFRNIHISHVRGTDVLIPFKIRGLVEAPVQNVTLTDISIDGKENSLFQYYENLKIKDVFVNGQPLELK